MIRLHLITGIVPLLFLVAAWAGCSSSDQQQTETASDGALPVASPTAAPAPTADQQQTEIASSGAPPVARPTAAPTPTEDRQQTEAESDGAPPVANPTAAPATTADPQQTENASSGAPPAATPTMIPAPATAEPGSTTVLVPSPDVCEPLPGTNTVRQKPSAPSGSQSEEIVLYSAGFDERATEDWNLEDGWTTDVDDQGSGVLTGRGHNWASLDGGQWGDFTFQTRMRIDSGAVHLNYRTSGCMRYFVGISEGGVTLSKSTACDNHPELRSVGAPVQYGQWHEIEIRGNGGHIQISVDGQKVVDYVDAVPIFFGGIAFESLDDSEVLVDWVKVTGKAAPSLGVEWVRTGGPLGGLGYDVRMNPADPALMYVTDAYAGVHLSTDGGNHWYPSNTGITTRAGESGDSVPIFSLTVDPVDPQIIWAGTQGKRGVFKSTDRGQTWVEKIGGITESFGITFRGFAIDPNDSNVVYGAAELSSVVWAGEDRSGREFDMTAGVVYKTVDGGESWRVVWRGDNLARYVIIDPRDSDIVYISTGIFDREAANSNPESGIPGGEGVLKSTDGGESWSHVNSGLRNLYVGTLFMHPSDPDTLLAGAGNNQYHESSGAYITTDGGATWIRTLSDQIITAVEFAQSDPNIAYAAGPEEFHRSTDGGMTWERVSAPEGGWGPPGVRAGFPIDLQVSPTDPDTVFANNYGGGNFVSRDGGRTWSVASTGYTGAQTRGIVVDPDSPGLVLVAARSGLFCSSNGGSQWTGLNYPPGNVLEWNAVALDPSDGQHLLAANNWNAAILESRDRGVTWRIVTGRLRDGTGWRSIEFAPSDPRVVYAGMGAYFSAGSFDDSLPATGISVSADGGASWVDANNPLSNSAHVRDLEVSSSDADRVFAATTNLGLLFSADRGRSWRQLNSGLPSHPFLNQESPSVLTVESHPQDPNVILVGLNGNGAYRSEDLGETWAPMVRGLNAGGSISDIVFDPLDPDVIYAADSGSGVFRSIDGGETWVKINDGLRNRAVRALAIASDGGTLYAATEGEGVFRLDLTPLPGSE